MHKNEKFEVNL